ncbi:MAG: hypothetical protein EOP64_00135 [Sphingomonas sp.]|nr:MAG: hypothetical protein EOP64_00135 [Sphingomonas sp.]
MLREEIDSSIQQQGHSLFGWQRFSYGYDNVLACRVLEVRARRCPILIVTKGGLKRLVAQNGALDWLPSHVIEYWRQLLYSEAADQLLASGHEG